MSKLLHGDEVINEIRGGKERVDFLLERNKPNGVIPERLLKLTMESLIRLGTDDYHEWKDGQGNIIIYQIERNPGSDVVYKVLDMNGLAVGTDHNKGRWPLALALCIVGDMENNIRSTAKKREWWLWGTNRGNFVLITHDHEGLGQFRYWLNPDD
ncbi:MAG: hypothetical protein A2534_00850 [Candidatus Magasanikbacteria bacterium RIFOXYD2_FULL_39_9]|uniref:Uncharacterized protein n=1 Tax=Candidatus Magasanikbacteria bacterium RIFOXYD1_FULL_40_23 TaxID=1798705 RepID=A0A1F6PB55_9BACT|nr:MAG: hypothetical protein A2534_00850 [Candidatus Magasanikbacteria bacterium RIFOXYD2_FULL_39_9]OGH93391.1 MAG: hypothetical protein A2563_02160 [Candidatus Magasanikbacteria bacterium RIFOXYD1_FULL_40_23]